MAEFAIAFNKTQGNEKGWANNPNDSGRETYAGISRKNFPSWSGWAIVDALKKVPNFPGNLEQNPTLQVAVLAFYHTSFWNMMLLDQVTDQDLANELFDSSVNMGCATATQFLQRALNVLNYPKTIPDLQTDGSMGPSTLNALSRVNAKDALKCVVALQGTKYIAICENNHSQEEFMKGWIRRAFSQFTPAA